MPLGTVLVVEDDPAIRRGLSDALRFSGYTVREAADGEAGLEAALADGIDLVLLDILMPKLDGLGVLSALRKTKPALPVIFLTARGQEEDRVRGLKSGADDYVVKPFSIGELVARVEAVLRRSPERPQRLDPLTIGAMTIDFDRREILHGGENGGMERALIPQREAELLCYLAAHRGRAIGREELLLRVWGVDPRGVATRTVDMAVARLREQLRDDPDDPKVIITVRGKGYMLAAAEGAAL